MAHTCGLCGCHFKMISAQKAEADTEEYELIKNERRVQSNHHYHHDCSGWKSSTKARRQYQRHPKRLQ